jgi:hypothetical protein
MQVLSSAAYCFDDFWQCSEHYAAKQLEHVFLHCEDAAEVVLRNHERLEHERLELIGCSC